MSGFSSALLRRQLDLLIERWDGEHWDHCCTKGCASPNGKHTDPAVVNDILRGSWKSGPIPQIPCPGTCTCPIGHFINTLRDVLEGRA